MRAEDMLGHALSFAADGSQYLTFRLGNEEFGVDILRVQEIKGFTTITHVPNTPPYIKGLMNLRGTIVPVVDLRIKFGLGDPKYDKFSVIVVVNVRDKITGLVVDAVSDVLSIAKDDIQPPPDFGSQITVQVMNGIARSADKLVILLDLERALDVDRSQLDALGAMRSES